MAKRTSLWILEKQTELMPQILDVYVDGDGHESLMRWIPPFRTCRALTAASAVATPSGTVGDWFHPEQIQAGWVGGTDYELNNMGGFWVDMYLCSSFDATRSSMGTICTGVSPNKAYVSQRGVAPRVSQTIDHFKAYLSARFAAGGFAGGAGVGWSGKGGLITDQHWFEILVWTRINRWLLRGNTSGYIDETVNPATPKWYGNSNEIGIRDQSDTAGHGSSITGGGPLAWDIPISDFCGNRWEFTDGLRLYNGVVYSAGKKINPGTPYSHADYTNTALSISSVTSGGSVASYRTEAALKVHGIPAATTGASQGGFDGGGFWYIGTGETIPLRGGSCEWGAMTPGALYMALSPASAGWYCGARAVLVP